MQLIPGWLERGYLQVIAPLERWLIAKRISPNLITVVGAAFWALGGTLYAVGQINAGGWLLGLSAFFDVVDGKVARATGRMTNFGAFFDSTLDRVADGCVLGGLALFYATNAQHESVFMLTLCLVCLLGTFLVSYTRARAESLGIHLKVGMMQRPERVILLSAPMAFFGLSLDGLVLASVVVFLTATAWITVIERVSTAYRISNLPANSGEEARVNTELVVTAAVESHGTTRGN